MGNVVRDGNYDYSYDAEGRPTTVQLNPVIYDALGREVESFYNGSYTQVVYAPDGYKFALMNGSTVRKYMAPLTAGLQAVYTANTPAGLAYYRHADWLGSSRLASAANRSVYYDGAYAPFGESYGETGTTDRSFTGQTQDTASGLYDFSFRQYSSSQGRWLVPDPAGLAAVDLTNPQTWNRYAYVGNNPLNTTDPTGLRPPQPDYVPTVPGAFGFWYKSQYMGDFGSAWTIDGVDLSDAPGLLGSGNEANTPVITNSHGTQFGLDAGGNWANLSNGSSLSSSDAAELGLPNMIGGPPNLTLISQAGFLGQQGASGAPNKGSKTSDQWPFNGNLLPLTPQRQDNVCTTWRLSGPMNSDPLILSCCQAHDNCYAAHGCNATSWIPNPLPWGACNTCNLKAAICIMNALPPIFIP